MEESFYFNRQVDVDTTLTLAPISDWEIEACGEALSDESGYFLIETTQTGSGRVVRLMAHIPSHHAAIELSRLLRLQ